MTRGAIVSIFVVGAFGCAPDGGTRPASWGGGDDNGGQTSGASDGVGDGGPGDGSGGAGSGGADTSPGDGAVDSGQGSAGTTGADGDAGDTAPADTGGGDTGWGTTGSSAGGTTGSPSSICDTIVDTSLYPPTVCDGPSGYTSTQIPSNDLYSTSWFGCYLQDNGSVYMDPYDNCEFACGNQGLCPAGQDGPTCEANLRWFAADADRYGCGGRIRVTNCENGNSVVLVTLDRGPNCSSVEMSCSTPVLDMSHDAMVYLFDGGTYGGCDHQAVVVEEVDGSTPLGPV